MIGKKISPVLVEIEDTLWEFEANTSSKPNYEIGGFRASIKIFISALMDKMWELQEEENISIEDRIMMAEKLGKEVKDLVKTYTNIDTIELYKND